MNLYEATRQQILPNFCSTMIRSLEEELSRIPENECSSFLKAKSCKGLINKSDYTAFMWAEDWDAKLAARRIVNYWDERLRLFGPEYAYLPLTSAGAMRRDSGALDYEDLVCVAREVDAKNRTILMINGREFQRKADGLTKERPVRSLWYVLQIFLHDNKVQQNGFAVILDGTEMPSLDGFTSLKKAIFHISEYLPMKLCALYACQPSLPLVRSFVWAFSNFRPKTTSKRSVMVVEGSKRHVVKELQQEGILWKGRNQRWSKIKQNK